MSRNTSGKACDACRRRKLKCSRTLYDLSQLGSSEKCVRCIETKLNCTFDDEHQKRGPKTGKRLRALRLAQNSCSSTSEAKQGPLYRSSSIVASALSLCDDQILSSKFNSVPDENIICSRASPRDISTKSNYMGTELHSLAHQGTTLDWFEGSCTGLEVDLEAETFVTTHEASNLQDSLNKRQQNPWLESDDNFFLLDEKLAPEISLFFHQGYVAYPLLHHDTVVRKINQREHLLDPEFRTLVLSIIMLNEACKVRLSPQHDQHTMTFLSRAIENLRNGSDGYHFAENPSIDTVVVSLFLFIAYNVSERHNRAFCYLTEAIGLFDLLGELPDPIDAIRQKRLRYVLYNTESATVTVYGSTRKRTVSQRPSTPLESIELLSWYGQTAEVGCSIEEIVEVDIVYIDKQALELLLLMTRLHLATGISEVASITVEDRLMSSVKSLMEGDSGHQVSYCDTQLADVAISRQWKLARLWWDDISRQPPPKSFDEAINSTIKMIATTTLTWSKTLRPGYLRIVGLGKLVGLTDSIFNISTKLGSVKSCTALIRHLIHTVAETDYNGYFAPQLSATEVCIGNIPRSLTFEEEFAQYVHELEEDVH